VSGVLETAGTPPLVPTLQGLRVTAGRLVGAIRVRDDEPQLLYELRLEVVAGTSATGEIRLGGLPLPGRSWRDLPGVSITFGAEAIEVYDGVKARVLGAGRLSFPHVQYPIHATSLRIRDGLEFRIALVVARPAAEGGDLALQLQATPDLGPIAVRGELEEPPPPGEAALALAARFLDLGAYRVAEDGPVTTLLPAD